MSTATPRPDQQQNPNGTIEDEIRLGGLKGVIWNNDGRFSVTAGKSWQDRNGDFHTAAVTLFANEVAAMAAILTRLAALLIDHSLVSNKAASTTRSRSTSHSDTYSAGTSETVTIPPDTESVKAGDQF